MKEELDALLRQLNVLRSELHAAREKDEREIGLLRQNLAEAHREQLQTMHRLEILKERLASLEAHQQATHSGG